ncbi:hypothetical protein Echvi_3648 [Echinicola vietnamensis DSM 17526]|uniref:Uncharacterized protein n=1 Tax=Echinicola vietnamensis (strain DSM 17526 / LMG 23754 / KMM 6221) TaxID=926556 RepID=L0G3G5_ECHVK|nr:hypothetical protein Echvi_3648 [Echinicola vietnamensis DSM 17526]
MVETINYRCKVFFHKNVLTFIPWKNGLIPLIIKTGFTEVLS